MDSAPESEKAPSVKNLDLSGNVMLTERALGVQWNVHTDTFGFKIIDKKKPCNRRGILSVICSVYDPWGSFPPVCYLLKKYNKICLQGLAWDDLIPETSKQKWEAWLRELPKLEQFQTPQGFKPQEFSGVKWCELHHFSDTSNQGYGAVSYLRQINAVGKIHCSLIMAKSRLAPLKAMAILRMEYP